MMMSCLKCGGAVGEPGKAYTYAGEWCHCPNPELPRSGEVVMVPQGTSVADFVCERSGVGSIQVGSPSTLMTPIEFVIWLRGYFAASGNDFDTIRAKLDTVGGPK